MLTPALLCCPGSWRGPLACTTRCCTAALLLTPIRRARSKDTFDSNWLRIDPTVFAIGFLGWTVPSNIPVGTFGSLFGNFNATIGANLAHFPTGPALDDKFWLYLITWHGGLFLTLLLGQIGVQGRKTGYW